MNKNNKYNRMQQLTILLKTHSDGLRKAEIARRLGVHRSTVGRYVDELSLTMPIWERYSMIGLEQRSNFDSEPHFTDTEGAFLLFLIKLYEQELNIKNPHASSVIRKISEGFKNAAPVLAEEFLETADRLDIEDSRFSQASTENYEKMSNAWLSSSAVSISYLHKSNGESCNAIYEPRGFFVCKNGDRNSDIAVKGLCRRTGELCTLRLLDFTSIIAPVININIEDAFQNLFCPISEFALSNRPCVEIDKHERLNMKEANHRIKNSLFMASSLVDITFSDLKDKEVQDKSKQLQNRINAIGMIHDQLSAENAANMILVDKFLTDLIERVLEVVSVDPSRVNIRLKVDGFLLSPKKALPLGMIISELITNSFKHSMGDESDVLKINVSKTNGIIRLRYSDGGEGFLIDSDKPGIGLEIIQNLCKQLNCVKSYKNNIFILEFPV